VRHTTRKHPRLLLPHAAPQISLRTTHARARDEFVLASLDTVEHVPPETPFRLFSGDERRAISDAPSLSSLDEKVDQENIIGGIEWYRHFYILKDCFIAQ